MPHIFLADVLANPPAIIPARLPRCQTKPPVTTRPASLAFEARSRVCTYHSGVVPAGVEEFGEPPRQRVQPGDVWPLVVVARKTRQSEVAGDGPTAVLQRNHMVDFVG